MAGQGDGQTLSENGAAAGCQGSALGGRRGGIQRLVCGAGRGGDRGLQRVRHAGALHGCADAGAGQRGRHTDWPRAGRGGDRTRKELRVAAAARGVCLLRGAGAGVHTAARPDAAAVSQPHARGHRLRARRAAAGLADHLGAGRELHQHERHPARRGRHVRRGRHRHRRAVAAGCAADGNCRHAAASAVHDGGADDVSGRGGKGGRQHPAGAEIQVGETARLSG